MKNIDEMTLEEAMKNLEAMVGKMEYSQLPLEKNLQIFEQGVQLVARARKLLEEYDQRITVLKKENGLIKEEELENSFDDDNE